MVVPRKQKGVEIQQNHDSNNPHFFTVIVSPSTQLLKLKIPNRFVKDHGKNLCNWAYLRVPNGEKNWPVQLLKCEGNVWFHTGWNQFAEHYSVSTGCFLVFRYDGTSDDEISRFRALLFDTTCSEINYSRPKRVPVVGNLETSEEDEGATDEDEVATDDDTSLDEIQPQSGKSYANPSKSPLQRAKAFRSSNPNFTVSIHRRNLSFNSGPALPMSHTRAYFKDNDRITTNINIILCVNNKTWPIKLRIEKKNRFCMTLTVGWKEFALWNELQEGDVCVFEMIKTNPKTYNVHLFPISKKMAPNPTLNKKTSDGRRRKGTKYTYDEETSRDLENKAYAFIGDSPGFIAPMRKSYVLYARGVPVLPAHSKEYFKDDGADLNAIVVKGKGGETWKIMYRFEASNARLASGWSKFKSDNRVEIGDVCAFTLIDRTTKTYGVHIFRINGKYN